MTLPARSAAEAKRARRLSAAAVVVVAVNLAVAVALAWPNVVPVEFRQALRAASLVATGVLALLLVGLVLGFARSVLARRESQLRQQALFDALPIGLAVWDADDRLEQTNADFLRVYAPIADLAAPGTRFVDLMRAATERGLVPEASGREEAWLAERSERRRHPGPPMLRQMADGRWRRIVEQRLPDGRLLSYSIDVTELEKARAEADLARQRLEDAIEALPAGFELYDADDHLLLANSVLKAMYPSIAELLAQPLTWEELVRENRRRGGLPHIEGDFEEWLRERREQRRAGASPRVQALPHDVWIRTYERRTRDGGTVGVRIDVSDVMRQDRELRRLNAQLDTANGELRRLTETDPLTGVFNRRAFEQRLTQAWQSGLPLALLILDVDHFKRFNDFHGHPAGDVVLRRVAAVLVAAIRSPSDTVARIGGEEFAVLLPETDLDSAMATAQRCLALLADADIAHGDSPIGPRVTASIGVAARETLPDDATPAQLVERADAGLYEAKAGGRKRAAVAGTVGV